jgi:hypothetical protein
MRKEWEDGQCSAAGGRRTLQDLRRFSETHRWSSERCGRAENKDGEGTPMLSMCPFLSFLWLQYQETHLFTLPGSSETHRCC